MKHCYESKNVPNDEHYAVLIFDTILIPGDEESRRWPGHGYPESLAPIVKYIAFDSKRECEEWLKNIQTDKNASYRIIVSRPCSVDIKTTTTISIGK